MQSLPLQLLTVMAKALQKACALQKGLALQKGFQLLAAPLNFCKLSLKEVVPVFQPSEKVDPEIKQDLLVKPIKTLIGWSSNIIG